MFLEARLHQAKLFRSFPWLEAGFIWLEVFKCLEPQLKWLNQEFYTLQLAYFEWKLENIVLKLLKIVYLCRKQLILQARSRLDLKFLAKAWLGPEKTSLGLAWTQKNRLDPALTYPWQWI